MHKSSKMIARELGISPHTVDQRLKVAMRKLEVASRREAATLLAHAEGRDIYPPLVYQSPDIAAQAFDGPPLSPDTSRELLPNGAMELQESRSEFLHGEPLVEPAPAGDRETINDLSYARRLLLILAIMIGSALAFGAIIAGLEALTSTLDRIY
jgi:hypothetical protein